jgi:hypothetical protein
MLKIAFQLLPTVPCFLSMLQARSVQISPASTAIAQPSTLPTKRSQENKYASNDEIAGVIAQANFALGEIVYDKNECKKGKITDIEAIYKGKILVPQYTIRLCKGSSTTEFVVNSNKSYEENLTATVIQK